MAVQTAAVRDGNLAINVRGTGEPLLLIHGVVVADAFDPMIIEGDLATKFQVVTYHRRGYQGSSPAPETKSIASEAADAVAVLDHLGLERAHVVGHSYGGAVALQVALDWPGRVQSLGLFEPALLTVPSAEAFGAALAPVGEKLETGDREGAFLDFLTLVGGENPMERLGAVPPEAREQSLADLGTLFASDAPALSGWELNEGDAASMSQPVLGLKGTESAPLFLETMDVLERVLPHIESVSLQSTHFLQMEKPAEAAGALRAFLERHPIKA